MTKNILGVAFLVLVMLVVPVTVALSGSMAVKWLVVACGGIAAGLVFLPWPNKENTLLACFAFFLCVNLDISFMPYPFEIKYYVTAWGFNLSIFIIIVALLYMLWLGNWRQERPSIDRRAVKFIMLYLMFTAWQLFSFINARYPLFSLFDWINHLLDIFILFYFLIKVRQPKQLEIMVSALMLGMILSSLVGIAQHLAGENLGLRFLGEAESFFTENLADSGTVVQRISGLLGHANMLGMYLALLIPVALAVSLADTKIWLKTIMFVSTGMAGSAIALTYSRGGLLGLVIALTVFVVLDRGRMWRATNRTLIVGYLVMGLLAVITFGPRLIQRFTEVTSRNVSVRYSLNEAALNMINQHPFFGVGLNNFSARLSDFDTYGLVYMAPYPVHNVYLLLAAEGGIPLLIIFLLFLILVFKEGLLVIKQQQNSFLRNLTVGCCCGMLAALVHSLFDYPLKVYPLYLNFLLMIGMILAIRFHMTERVDE